ncbi:MAG: LptF/LptG family permease [Alphaproteobacteria bacterium]|jgi:lipopolysaccharide export system permease protein|nr:LptF/LptG family permease [Alphaproteobacteria bacterium]
MISTLNLYLVRRFAVWLMIVTLGFGAIAMLGDFLEMLRLANRLNLGAGTAFGFTLHRLPLLLMDFLPFVFLFATVFCLLRLSQAQELAVIRAAGLSVWQFLKPLLVFTFVLSTLIILALEPIGAQLHNRFTDSYAALTSQKSSLSFSTGGVWFRETTQSGSYISRAKQIDDAQAGRLLDVEIIQFDESGAFESRITAPSGQIADGLFRLTAPRFYRRDEAVKTLPQWELSSSLTSSSLADNFANARIINVWQLPGYIAAAGKSGIDVTRHEVRLQSLLALPILLMAMVMVAACFSLPTGRMFTSGQTLGLSVLCGFGLFLFNDFIVLMGELNLMPPIMASWVPAFIALLLSISYLLTTEDG